ncbi:MAG: hypothetical protein MJ164_03815 [Alphaproteobacteria bacterium]|nr:hypothetical protein [Alphaproteobacteria bacterium]
MTEFIHSQNSFANGEIAPEFYLTKNISGLSRLENMDVLSGGGLTRRFGLADIATLDGTARVFSFDMSEQENYVLVFTNRKITIFLESTQIDTIVSPWTDTELPNIQFAGRGNSVIFTHPDVPPYVLTKDSSGFSLHKFSFYDSAGLYSKVPLIKYDDMRGVSINVSAGPYGVKSATLTASEDYWTSTNIETFLYFNNQLWQIIEYVSPTVVYASSPVEYTLPVITITDWLESAFDYRHGWPCAITFHQDRLVFGGTHSVPGGIWMSRVGQHYNFDVGTGLDDEAIITTLLSKERQQICYLISSDKLQILTSTGEWAISNQPLTPSDIDIKQHTSVGSVSSHCLIPQKIESETVFISGNSKDIRKLSLDTLGEKYNADDLCAFAKHLINNPIDISYNPSSKHLFVVNSDGTMAVLTYDIGLGISAWARYTTYGNFVSVTESGGDTFVVIEYMNTYKLAKFSDTTNYDSGIHEFQCVVAGVPMTFSGHRPNHLRLRKINLRLWQTKCAYINNMRVELPNEVYSVGSLGFSGDISMNFLGSQVDPSVAPWVISSTQPMPITVLSVTVYGQYEI